MRRRTVHAAFAVASLVAAGALGLALLELERAREVNRALSAVTDRTVPTGAVTVEAGVAAGDAGAGTSSGEEAGASESGAGSAGSGSDEAPRVRLARASALAASGEVEVAERLFTALAREHGDTPLGRAARLGLANRYLREGAVPGLDPRAARPLLELAKQRYRDLLRDHPDDADARYNLERALRLAPEGEDAAGADADDPVKSVNVVVPGFAPKDLP